TRALIRENARARMAVIPGDPTSRLGYQGVGLTWPRRTERTDSGHECAGTRRERLIGPAAGRRCAFEEKDGSAPATPPMVAGRGASTGLVAVGDPAAREVVRRELERNAV